MALNGIAKLAFFIADICWFMGCRRAKNVHQRLLYWRGREPAISPGAIKGSARFA